MLKLNSLMNFRSLLENQSLIQTVLIYCPTNLMLADPLTKSVTTRTFMRWITTGTWDTRIDAGSNTKFRIRRAVKRPSSYGERDLEINTPELDDGSFGEQLQISETFAAILDHMSDTDFSGLSFMQTDVTISTSPDLSGGSGSASDNFTGMVCPPCEPPPKPPPGNPRPPRLGHCTYFVDGPHGYEWCGEPCVRIHDPDRIHRGECRCEAHFRNRYYLSI